mmetsp:Transcript_9337/g.15535  ORF Transcript_9337/g.15535 Transcript_9337/m.15535 type:complete len:88 (-) Transcript_9337:665-928(-)
MALSTMLSMVANGWASLARKWIFFWTEAKKSNNLVKFGGGFYAGKIPLPSTQPNRLMRRRTSGDMSVFTSGESVMDAVLSAEGGKML